jgi:acyl-CoA synthetase (AMP-forming)/AMP-acid ligase II
VFCLPRADDTAEVRLASVGRPFPGHDVRISDPLSGSAVPLGAVGEIQVHGPGVPPLEDQGDSDSSFSSDGWLRTGDLGSLTSDNVLRYHGRLTEMMNIAGENVSAMEIEMILSAHPGVAVAQVIGIPDEHSGQAAAAFVELHPGYDLHAEDLIGFCRDHGDRLRVPRYIAFVESWPTTASKIFKPALEKMMREPRLFD